MQFGLEQNKQGEKYKKEEMMCDLDFINAYSFYYSDGEYFEWFRNPNEENFDAIVKWKRLNRISGRFNIEFDNIWQEGVFNEEFVNNLELVSRVFLLHLNNPNEYPLFDRYVWWALRTIQNNNALPKNTNSWTKYIRIYKPFFEDMFNLHQNNIQIPEIDNVNTETVKRRIVDRALWEYGRTLNNLGNNQ